MNRSLKELEAKIRKLCTDSRVCDPQELVGFTLTNNLELEVEKNDGSKVRILKRLLARCEKDPVAKLQILDRLKNGFKRPKREQAIRLP